MSKTNTKQLVRSWKLVRTNDELTKAKRAMQECLVATDVGLYIFYGKTNKETENCF